MIRWFPSLGICQVMGCLFAQAYGHPKQIRTGKGRVTVKKSAMRPDPSHRHKFLRPACKYPQLKLATQPGMKQMAELALSGLYKSWTKNTSIRIPSVRRIGDPLFVQVQWFSFDGKEAENV